MEGEVCGDGSVWRGRCVSVETEVCGECMWRVWRGGIVVRGICVLVEGGYMWRGRGELVEGGEASW